MTMHGVMETRSRATTREGEVPHERRPPSSSSLLNASSGIATDSGIDTG